MTVRERKGLLIYVYGVCVCVCVCVYVWGVCVCVCIPVCVQMLFDLRLGYVNPTRGENFASQKCL
jgi:hypothetical protein